MKFKRIITGRILIAARYITVAMSKTICFFFEKMPPHSLYQTLIYLKNSTNLTAR